MTKGQNQSTFAGVIDFLRSYQQWLNMPVTELAKVDMPTANDVEGMVRGLNRIAKLTEMLDGLIDAGHIRLWDDVGKEGRDCIVLDNYTDYDDDENPVEVEVHPFLPTFVQMYKEIHGCPPPKLTADSVVEYNDVDVSDYIEGTEHLRNFFPQGTRDLFVHGVFVGQTDCPIEEATQFCVYGMDSKTDAAVPICEVIRTDVREAEKVASQIADALNGSSKPVEVFVYVDGGNIQSAAASCENVMFRLFDHDKHKAGDKLEWTPESWYEMIARHAAAGKLFTIY